MKKTFKKSILFTAIALLSICNIALASNASLNNWPDKDRSARIIRALYLQTAQELNTVARATQNELTQDRVIYLKRLSNAIRNSDQDPEEVFKEIHQRHLGRSGITDEQTNNYIKLAEEIEEYVFTAG